MKISDAAATAHLNSPPLLSYRAGARPSDLGVEQGQPELNAEVGERLLLTTALLVSLVVLLRNAWLAEDAYVTFRTLDNFAHGHGLRWNAVDRVQAYSNPLWLFALVPFHFLFGDPYPAALVLSLLLSFGVVFLCARSIAVNRAAALLGVVLLMSSRAFVDYSTSGLENPLTHFLLGLLFLAYLKVGAKEKGASARNLLGMSALLALLAVNRIDTLLLGLPMLAVCWFRSEAKGRHRALLLGMLPLFLWELVSLVYYGSLIPNTAYAKLNTGIDKAEVLKQGGVYFVDLLSLDPLSFVVLLLGASAPFIFRQRGLYAPVAGLVVYLLYIVFIGGDFMSGRFFSAPVLLSCFVLTQISLVSFQQGIAAAGIVLGLSLFGPNSPLTSTGDVSLKGFGDSGVADERSYYYVSTGLLRLARPLPFPENSFLSEGRRDRELAKKDDKKTIRKRINVGFYGFAAGRDVHIIDPLALGDPLLARLPAAFEPKWRVGHYDRVVPLGYEGSIRSGQADLKDANLNRYYKKLLRVAQGPIWSAERWRTMWGLLSGRYDSLIDRQRYRYADPQIDRPPLAWRDLSVQGPLTKAEGAKPAFQFSGLSILIQCARVERLKSFEWYYASPKPSELYFLKDTRIVGRVKLPSTAPNLRHKETITVPTEAQKIGFDGIYFRGERGPFQHQLYGVEVQ